MLVLETKNSVVSEPAVSMPSSLRTSTVSVSVSVSVGVSVSVSVNREI